MNLFRIVGLVSVGFAVVVEAALAGVGTAPAPAPIAGLGLPALVLIGGVYWVGRKFFGRKD